MSSIESITRSEIYDFIHNPITVVDGYEFNQYENVKRTHLYLNSKFYETGNSQTDQPLVDGLTGTEEDRIFFNVTLPRVRAVERFFDIDVADVVIDEIDPQSELALQLLNKDFDRFAEEHNLSEDFNQFVRPLIRYGSLVLEITKSREPVIIPLSRYFVDPTVKCSKDSRFNTIKYTMTPAQLREKVAEGWDEEAIEEIIEAHEANKNAPNSYEDDGGVNKVGSSTIIDVYKRYGYLPEYMVKGGDSEKEIFAVSVTAFGRNTLKHNNKEDDSKCLYKAEWTSDMPIIDHHLHKTEGRWQGIGVVELLYPIQQRMNEIANQKRISMELSAIHLFQTADPTVLNNILSDLQNGDVIKTKTPGAITPLATEERNLPAFNDEIVTYQTQGDKLSFANDLLSGGDVPSTTPATNVVVQNNNQVLVHLQDRENFTNFVANNYIKKWVVPKILKDLSDEHFLRIVSQPDDLLQIDEKMVDVQFWEIVKKRALEKGQVIDILEQDDLRNEIMRKMRGKGPNRYVKVLKNYYKDKLGDVIVLIGNEKKDLAKMQNNSLSFFQMLQNPQMLDDPVIRAFAVDYARQIGMDTGKLELAYAKRDNMVQEQQAQQPQLPQPVEEKTPEDKVLANVL